jgi:hypothetical protein
MDGFGGRLVVRKPFLEKELANALKRLLAL